MGEEGEEGAVLQQTDHESVSIFARPLGRAGAESQQVLMNGPFKQLGGAPRS